MKHVKHMTSAAKSLGLPCREGKHQVKLFSGTVEVDFSVQLRDWRYPLGVNAQTGEAKFDNYNGSWGNERELDAFHQKYAEAVAVEAAGELERDGFILDRAVAANGDVELVYTRQA